jgi:hypothetical protein
LRQRENQYLANDLDKIRQLLKGIQRFAGFGVSKPYMGWVGLGGFNCARARRRRGTG